MNPKYLFCFIDLKKFPIDKPESSNYQKIIEEAKETLEFYGLK